LTWGRNRGVVEALKNTEEKKRGPFFSEFEEGKQKKKQQGERERPCALYTDDAKLKEGSRY
jgi:hypothetical protein